MYCICCLCTNSTVSEEKMDFKIRVKVIEGTENPSIDQSKILDAINSSCETIDIANIYSTRDGAIIKMLNIDSVYALLEQEAKDKLKDHNLKPVTPAWLNPTKTLFVHQLPRGILDRKNEEIRDEIKKSNQEIAVEFAAVIRSNKTNRKFLKLTLNTPEVAAKTFNKGFRLFNFIVTPDMIAQHRLKDQPEVTQCYKCFSFEHPTNRCTSKDTLCSRCHGAHHYTECEEEEVKCNNCKSDHHSASPECPLRKQMIERKKKEIKDKNNAETDKTQPPSSHVIPNAWEQKSQTPPPKKYQEMKDETQAARMTIISKFAEMMTTGQFDPQLYIRITNKVLEFNNLPRVEIPEEVMDISFSHEIDKTRMMRMKEQEIMGYEIEEIYAQREAHNEGKETNEVEDILNDITEEERRDIILERKKKKSEIEKVKAFLGPAPPSNFTQEWGHPTLPHNTQGRDESWRCLDKNELNPVIRTGARQKERTPLMKTRSSERINQLHKEKENESQNFPNTQDSFNQEFLMKDKITEEKDDKPLDKIDELSDTTYEDVEVEKDNEESGNEGEEEDNETEEEKDKEKRKKKKNVPAKGNNRKDETSESEGDLDKELPTASGNKGKKEIKYEKIEFVKTNKNDNRKKRNSRK